MDNHRGRLTKLGALLGFSASVACGGAVAGTASTPAPISLAKAPVTGAAAAPTFEPLTAEDRASYRVDPATIVRSPGEWQQLATKVRGCAERAALERTKAAESVDAMLRALTAREEYAAPLDTLWPYGHIVSMQDARNTAPIRDYEALSDFADAQTAFLPTVIRDMSDGDLARMLKQERGSLASRPPSPTGDTREAMRCAKRTRSSRRAPIETP